MSLVTLEPVALELMLEAVVYMFRLYGLVTFWKRTAKQNLHTLYSDQQFWD